MLALALFVLTVLPRIFYFFSRPYEDPSWSPHWNLAAGLLQFGTLGYHGEKVTNIEPGYPFFIAAGRLLGRGLTPVILLQIAAAGAGAVFIYRLAVELSKDKRAAFLAGLFYAFYPYLIGQSAEIIEVTLFTSLLAASAYFFSARPSALQAVSCGAAFGLTLLTRSMIFPAFALGLLFLCFQKRFRHALIVFLVTVAVALPWMLRNRAVDGSWVPPRSGWNLLQGNCPYSDKIIPRYNPDLLDAYVNRLLDKEKPEWSEAEGPQLGRQIDDYFTAKAKAFMKEHPWRTARLKVLNVFYLFHPRIVPFYGMDAGTRIDFTGPETFEIRNLPERGALKEAAHSIFYGFILLTALGGIYLRRNCWREDMFLYFIIFNFTVVYSVYWPATRLRVPMDFILMFFSAVFAVSVYDRFQVKAHAGA